MSKNNIYRPRLSRETADIVDQHAKRQGKTSREMLEEMVRVYDSGIVGTVESNAEKLNMLLEAHLGDESSSRSRAHEGETRAQAEPDTDNGAEVATDGAAASQVRLSALSAPHNVALDPEEKDWSDECYGSREKRLAAIQGFVNNSQFAEDPFIPREVFVRLLEEGFDGFSKRSVRRYINEYGPDAGLWYPDVTLGEEWIPEGMYEALVAAKCPDTPYGRERVREEYPTVSSFFEGVTVDPRRRLVHLSEESLAESMETLLEYSEEFAENGGGRVSAVWLSYVVWFVSKKGLVDEARLAEARREFSSRPGFDESRFE